MDRVRIIHLRDSPFVGGPEKQILGQCALLDRSRFEPHVVSFGDDQPTALNAAAEASGISTAMLADGRRSAPRAVSQLRSLLRQSGECVVISSGFKADLTAWAACRVKYVPWLAWFHGYTGVTRAVRIYEAVDLRVLRGASAVIAVCDAAAEQLRRIGLSNVVTIPNAVDVDGIASRGTRESARRALGVGDGEIVIGTAARLSPEKGIEYMIDAASGVISKHPSARFIVIGDGPSRQDLEHRVRDLRLEEGFRFVGFRADAAELMKAFDVFVLPSLRENLPIALLEAMACGIHVVATDVGGVREVIEPAGVSPIAPGSVRAIEVALLALLDDLDGNPSIAAMLSARAREYSFERQAAGFQHLIEQASERVTRHRLVVG